MAIELADAVGSVAAGGDVADSDKIFGIEGTTLRTWLASAMATYIIAKIVDSAPSTLDTLNELAAALGDDPNFATTMTSALAGKQPLDSDLTAIAAIAANGLIARTGSGTAAARSIAAGSAKISVSNGDGASGNPTIDLGSVASTDMSDSAVLVRIVSPPASAGATGAAGQIAFDSSYFYVCTATNTWLRAPIATW
ncbi:hypothetical protein ACFQ1E_17265 [Sphingomonas canadensis]|uniref:Uncharacterized protein n=1 Tax=Sphingomonas canadensis TaxID=1219257 RepID=A0ABW3HEK3_9SPHN|nr:hypothetical protein [Sphingomonas canadensis]MCW3837797.1 hypothetical protein [Sphingomonas canadensis]